MAKLYYYYGAMGSSKTANALMTKFNYWEVGQKALLCKPAMDTRDGNLTVHSRIGLEEKGILLEDFVKYTEEQVKEYTEKFKYPELFFRGEDGKIFGKKLMREAPELER